ncbi:hypothetical protein BD413DRAFT_615516 [Trametes elegans]|nr:hypothetical protein BD413DRAFT_615516 [Trametes elegans]
MSDSDASGIIDVYQSTFSVSYTEIAAASLLAYEYMITLDQEIKLFWMAPFTGATALFFFVRYSTILYDILDLLIWAPLSDSVEAAVSIISFAPWAAFSALRVLALSGMNWSLAALVFVLSLAPIAVNFSGYGFGLTGVNYLTLGCQTIDNISAAQEPMYMYARTLCRIARQADQNAVVSVSRGCLIVADIIVIIVTVVSMRSRGPNVRLGQRRSLTEVMFYDGLIYFAMLTCFNIIHLVLTFVSIVTPYQQTSYLTLLADPMSSILIWRFLLDLQAANAAARGLLSTDHGQDTLTYGTGTIQFASRMIGSLGATLQPGSLSEELDEDEDEVEYELSEGQAKGAVGDAELSAGVLDTPPHNMHRSRTDDVENRGV